MNKIKAVIMFIFCVFSLFLVIMGQGIKSSTGLLIMLAGLAGLILELYLYNRKYV